MAEKKIKVKKPTKPQKTPIEIGFKSYNPEFVEAAYTEREMREEYRRLKSNVSKRLKRFEAKGMTDNPKYKYYKSNLQDLRSVEKGDTTTLVYMLYDVHKAYTDKKLTVTAAMKVEEKEVQTLQNSGYLFVNKRNLRRFGEWMEYVRSANMAKILGSERVATMFELVEKKGLSPSEVLEDFAFYERERERIISMPKIKQEELRNRVEYERRFEEADEKKKRSKKK